VDGLTISGNTIIQTKEHPEVHPGKPMIDLVNCRNVRIEGNTYEGDNPASVAADALSAGTLRIGENTGFTVRRP
jgi:polygalacturonase